MNCYRYAKGQVWYIERNSGYTEATTNEIKKDRPWLIVSVGESNDINRLITAVPLTTRDWIRNNTEVQFTSPGDRSSVALCQQVRTFSTYGSEYNFNYEFTVSSDVMYEVESALGRLFGLPGSDTVEKVLFTKDTTSDPSSDSSSAFDKDDDDSDLDDLPGVEFGTPADTRKYVSLSRETVKQLLADSNRGMTVEELSDKYNVAKSAVVNYKFNWKLYE